MVSMSTSTQPARTDADLADLLRRLTGPTPAPRMWSVCYDGPGARIFNTALSAATFITDETRRRVKSGTSGTLTVASLDSKMVPTADLSAEVIHTLFNTSWINQAANPSYAVAYLLRDQVIYVIESVLVRDSCGE